MRAMLFVTSEKIALYFSFFAVKMCFARKAGTQNSLLEADLNTVNCQPAMSFHLYVNDKVLVTSHNVHCNSSSSVTAVFSVAQQHNIHGRIKL